MARQTKKSGGKATVSTRETRRITSLEAKSGHVLTSLEEAVVRMHHGVSVKAQAQLPTNGVTDELMGQLFEMEVRAHVESGRIDELPDVPASKKKTPASQTKRASNSRTAKVVAELKKKK
jgi:hypothetical protein